MDDEKPGSDPHLTALRAVEEYGRITPAERKARMVHLTLDRVLGDEPGELVVSFGSDEESDSR